MADFPDTIFTPRTIENIPTVSFDASKTTYLFAEDYNTLADEIVAIEEFLNPTTLDNTYSTLLDGVDEYINIPDDNSLSFTTTSSKVSFSVWVKFTSLGGGQFLISKYDTSVAGLEYAFAIDSSNKLYVLLSDNGLGGGTLIWKADNAITATNTWMHLVGTANIATDVYKLYIDGSEVSGSHVGVQSTILDMINTTTPVRLGAAKSGGGSITNFLNGYLDEVSIWNKELSASEVSGLYNAGIPTDLSLHTAVANIVSWWRMGDDVTDDLTGTTGVLVDQIGSNNGTPINTESGDKVADVPS